MITNDIGVAGATDWLAKTGLDSNKTGVSTVEPSFVQIMTSLENGTAPIPLQMDMASQGLEQQPTPQDIGALDLAVTDEDSAQFLLAMVASLGSGKAVLGPPIVEPAAGITTVLATNGDVAVDELPVTLALDLDAALALVAPPSDLWGVAQIDQVQVEPVDPSLTNNQEITFLPVVTVGPNLDSQQLALPLGAVALPLGAVALPLGALALPVTALTAMLPESDLALLAAVDGGLGANVVPVVNGKLSVLDGTVDVPFTSMTDRSIFEIVKIVTPDAGNLTGEQMPHDVTYQVVGVGAGMGRDTLSYPVVTADEGTNVTPLRPLVVQGDVLNPVVKVASGPTGVATVLTAVVTDADPQVVPAPAPVQAQVSATKPPVDTNGMPSQTAPAGDAAGDLHDNAIPQQQAARAVPATPANGAASMHATGKNDGPGVAQTDRAPVIAPDQVTSAIQMSKTAQLALGAATDAVQQVTVPRQPLPPTLGPDPVLAAATQIDFASGGSGSASQGGSGQTGSGVAGQGAASLQGQLEAALDVRQQGWTKTLVNRAINAAQAGGSLTIKILPAHLGQITLKLSEGKRGTDLRIIADVPATASMLRDVQDQLSSAFENAGLTLGTYSASTGNNGGEGSQKDGYTDEVTPSELTNDTAQSADDVAGADNLSRINILL
ncbi:flagellar hook-length control protein FliK [Yoonia vestfoldensis]|uniref:flagellar hook-length control protein FliK n=1 Tax=Yoonia vestfoldensis TaxID=245188 RepID=UPI0013EF748A|nr:flagellar hook-length control protein FliK [Yoonia vestfoldensis]